MGPLRCVDCRSLWFRAWVNWRGPNWSRIRTGIRSVVLRNGGGAASQGNNSAIVTPRGESTMAMETALLGSICDGNIPADRPNPQPVTSNLSWPAQYFVIDSALALFGEREISTRQVRSLIPKSRVLHPKSLPDFSPTRHARAAGKMMVQSDFDSKFPSSSSAAAALDDLLGLCLVEKSGQSSNKLEH